MTEITQQRVDEAVAATWIKLEAAVQRELDKVLAGESELSASTTAAVVKFIEASKDMANDPQLRIKDWQVSLSDLPTFDDDENDFAEPKPTKTATKRKNKQ
jgi:hypothetical protein